MSKEFHDIYNNIKSMTKKRDKVRNTVNIAVLEGDHEVKDVLAILFSFYDAYPVYFLSTLVEDVKRSKIPQKSIVKQCKEKLKIFVLTNFVDIYNYEMNSVNRKDYLRTNYALDQGLRQ